MTREVFSSRGGEPPRAGALDRARDEKSKHAGAAGLIGRGARTSPRLCAAIRLPTSAPGASRNRLKEPLSAAGQGRGSARSSEKRRGNASRAAIGLGPSLVRAETRKALPIQIALIAGPFDRTGGRCERADGGAGRV